MKVLLDENLPHRLRHYLPGHEVATVVYKRWDGIVNGRLLDLAEADGFDVFVTGDQSVPFQQNIGKRKIAVVMLVTLRNDFEAFEPLMGDVITALETIQPSTVIYIEEQA